MGIGKELFDLKGEPPIFETTLPETNIFTPENWWLDYKPFLWEGLFYPIFRGELLVLGRVTNDVRVYLDHLCKYHFRQ